jgi:tetratricopeptide (TPR) repeat protein
MQEEVLLHFQKGKSFFQANKFWEAIEYFKKALAEDKNQAEIWLLLGICYVKVNRIAEAGMNFQRAIQAYEVVFEDQVNIAASNFGKARAFAYLNMEYEMVESLQKALRIDPNFAETTLELPEFQAFIEKSYFRELLKTHIDLLISLQFKGEKIKLQQLDAKQNKLRRLFIQKLKEAHWQVEDFEELIKAGMAVSPQAKAEFLGNKAIRLRLEYYLDEHLLFMEMQNLADSSDIQAYRLYLEEKLPNVLQIITHYQHTLDIDNWGDMLEQIVEFCDTVLLEMPDGRKIKIS